MLLPEEHIEIRKRGFTTQVPKTDGLKVSSTNSPKIFSQKNEYLAFIALGKA